MAYAAPVDYQDRSGVWETIDPTLIPSTTPGYAWHDAANGVDVELPASLGAAPVALSAGSGSMGFGLDGAGGAVEAAGAAAVYPGALPGVTVSYLSEDNGLKESLALAGPSAASTFTYAVTVSAGETLVPDGEGGLVLDGADGRAVFGLPAPSMRDAAGASSGDVTMTATGGGSVWTVTVRADPVWLGAPGRAWPVTVDPTVTFSAATYCTLSSSAPTTSSCDATSYSVSPTQHATVEFPAVGSIGNAALIESASLHLDQSAATGTGSESLAAAGLTEPWDTTATWDDRTAGQAWATPGGTTSGTPADVQTENVTPTGSEMWAFDVASLVQGWVSGAANDGILVTDSAGTLGATFTGSGTTPYLAVLYEARLGAEPFHNVSKHTIDDQETLGVNAANGNLLVDATDYAVTGTGLSMRVARTYNSRSMRVGSLGTGWSLDVGADVRLTQEAGGGYLYDDRDGANWTIAVMYGTSGYVIPAGLNAAFAVSGSMATLTYNTSQEVLGFTALAGCAGMALTSDTDRNGNRLTYSYAGCSLYTITLNRAGETLAQGRTWTVATSSDGLVTAVTETDFAGGLDSRGTATHRTIGYGYDQTGTYLTSFTDADGQVTAYHYNPAGQLDRVTNPDGHVITLTYLGDGRAATATAVTNLSTMTGDTTTYTYNTNLLSADQNSLAAGTTAGWTQGSAASIAVATVAKAGTYSLAATSAGTDMLVATTAIPAEHGQTYQGAVYVRSATTVATVAARLLWYDKGGALISISTGASAADSTAGWTAYSVGDSAPAAATAVAFGLTFTATTSGAVHYADLAWLNPGSKLTNLATTQGLPYAVGRACGSGGNPAYASMPATIYSLAANTQTDANGHTTTYCYDGADQVTTSIDGLGRGRSTSYTANSDVSTTTDAMTTPGVATSTYFSANQPKQVQAPATGAGGAGRTVRYGGYGTVAPSLYQPGTATDSQGNQSTLGYDTAGNLTTVTDADRRTASVTHNPDGTVASQTDPGGTCGATPSHCTTTSYTYAASDPTVLATKVTTPPAPLGTLTATYDPDTRLANTVNGNGYETLYCYDNDNRPTKVFYNVTVAINCATTTSPAPDLSYTYDADGNLTQKTDNASTATTSYGYDNLDRPVTSATDATVNCTVDIPGSSISYPADACVTYDPAGNVTAYTDSGGTVAFTYDAANQNLTVAEPGGSNRCSVSTDGTLRAIATNCSAFAYNNNGTRVQTLYPSGELISVDADTSGRVDSITSTGGGVTIAKLAYTYTAAGGADSGLIRAKTDSVAGTTTTYGYDPENRLCWAATETGTATPPTTGCPPPAGTGLSVQSYTYDPYGNMASQTSPAGTVTSYGNNQANQLCWSITASEPNDSCASVPTGATTWAYDADGNQTANTTNGTPGLTASYTTSDQTLTSTDDTGAGSTPYAYADAGQTTRLSAGGLTFLNTLTGIAATSVGGTTVYYTRDANGTIIGLRKGPGATSTNYYYTTDNQGSILALNDATTAATTDATYTYDPYGVTTIGTNINGLANTNHWRYTGGWYDINTQKYHYGARYYDPTTARWTQPDPAKRGIQYLYANNNPASFADPAGTDSCTTVGGYEQVNYNNGIFGSGIAYQFVLSFQVCFNGTDVTSVGSIFTNNQNVGAPDLTFSSPNISTPPIVPSPSVTISASETETQACLPVFQGLCVDTHNVSYSITFNGNGTFSSTGSA